MSAVRKLTRSPQARRYSVAVLPQLGAHFPNNRTQLREEWTRRITEVQLLAVMAERRILTEIASICDNYVDALEAGGIEASPTCTHNQSERVVPRRVENHESVGIVLLLCEILARSLIRKYQSDFVMLNRVLEAYKAASNRVAVTVAVGFVQEWEKVIREQQEVIRKLSTPLLPVRKGLLMLPIVSIQPEIGFSVVQLGIRLGGVAATLDLEESLEFRKHKAERISDACYPK